MRQFFCVPKTHVRDIRLLSKLLVLLQPVSCKNSVRLVYSLNVNSGQVRDDQIKINFSSCMPLIRHLKTSNKTIIADDLNYRYHLLT